MIKSEKRFPARAVLFVLFALAVCGGAFCIALPELHAAAIVTSAESETKELDPVTGPRNITQNGTIRAAYTYPSSMYDNLSQYVMKVKFDVSTTSLGNGWGGNSYAISTATIYKETEGGSWEVCIAPQVFGIIERHFNTGGARYGSTKINDDADIQSDFSSKGVTVDVPNGAKWSDYTPTGDGTSNAENGKKTATLTVSEAGTYKAVLWSLGYCDGGPTNAAKLEYEFTYGNGANAANAAVMGRAADGSGRELENHAHTNGTIKFTAMNGDVELYSDGSKCVGKSATVTSEGTHTFYVDPQIGSRAQYSYVIDRTAPTLAFEGVTAGGFSRGNVKVTGSDQYGTVASIKYSYRTDSTFPSSAAEEYVSGQTLDTAGNYYMVVTDDVGNSRSYTFTIDKSAPALSLSGVGDGGFTAQNVTISWDSSAGGVTGQRCNGNDLLSVAYARSGNGSFPSAANTAMSVSTAFSAEGNYLVTIADRAGNSSSYTFTIDRTAPTLTLEGVTDGGFTRGSVSISWDRAAGGNGATLTNGNDSVSTLYSLSNTSAFPASATAPYTSALSAEGNYLVTIADRAGNSRSYTFTIDRTAPALTLEGVADGGFTRGSVSAGWSDSVGSIGAARTNGNDSLSVMYSRDDTDAFPSVANSAYVSALSAEGNYLVTIADRAGNSSSYTFTIDRTAPTLTLEGVTDGGFTRGSVSISWDRAAGGNGATLTNGNDSVSTLYSLSNTSAFPASATAPYASALSAEGNYLVTIADKAGNSRSYTFTIDRTAPALTLDGVTDNGFTRGSVSAGWSTAVGGVGAARTNGNDSLSVMYSRSETAAFPASATSPYTSALSEEGNYRMTIADRAGNSRSYTFTIDRTAPALSLDGVTDNGFTRGNVSAEWSDSVGGVGAARTNGNDSLSVMYSRSETADFPASATSAYASALSAEGNYLVTIADKAGNSRSYTFTIDRTAPQLAFDTVENGGATKDDTTAIWASDIGGVGGQLVNAGDSLTVKYDHLDGAAFPERATSEYAGPFTAEGRYLVVIMDRAGNSMSYTFTLDKTAPILRVNADMVGGEAIYGGTPVLTWSDHYGSVEKVEAERCELIVTERSIAVGASVSHIIAPDGKLDLSGIYTIRLTDSVGNESVATFALLCGLTSFNREAVEQSGYLKAGNYRVKIPYMKTVTIPARGKDGKESRYPGMWSNTNTYVFASYENALRFMTEVEMEEAVTANGNGLFVYYQRNNHAVTTTYGDVEGARATMADLYAALEKYASAQVSAYVLPSLRSPYVGSDTVIMDAEALYGVTPGGEQRIGGDFVFRGKEYSIAFGGKTFSYNSLVHLKIGRGGEDIYDDAYQAGKTFSEYIVSDRVSGANGGVYTITETDALGNVVIYDVYLDRMAPTFLAEYTYFHASTDERGDMQAEVLTAEQELASNRQIDGNLRSLTIKELLDNSDEIVTAVVTGPDGTSVTTMDPALLTFGVGGHFTLGGEYHVRLYDRTGNLFDYGFTIYGGAPRVTSQIRGTGDNRSITISFSNANAYSSIVRFAIYRYGVRLPEGEYSERVDGKVLNTVYIEQGTWTYRFILGGVYTVRFEDSFGNVTESEEIVFSKGLPTYTLTGAEAGAKTRKDVSVTFADTTGCEVRKDGSVVTVAVAGTADGQELRIAATEENNGIWEIKLYVKSDPNTYVTVRFSVDTIAPTARAAGGSGETVAWDTTTREAFRIEGTDSDVERVRYRIGDGLLQTYTAGELLSEDGAYTIILTDDAGNSTTYQLVRDTIVKFEVEYSGAHYEREGILYLREGFTVQNGEWLEMTMTRDGAIVEAPRFNFLYLTEGAYEIVLKDGVGNEARAEVAIDQTAPAVTVVRGADEYSPVTIEAESADVASMAVRKDGKSYPIELADRMTFTLWGNYGCTFKDALGNACAVSFTILKVPPKVEIFSTTGDPIPDGGQTNGAVYIVWDDPSATARVVLANGTSKLYTQKTVFMSEGTYTVTVTDAAKNVVSVSVTIVRTVRYRLNASDGEPLEPVWLNDTLNTAMDFSVSFGSDIQAVAKLDGVPFAYTAGQVLTSDGLYTFLLTDGVGNEEVLELNHDAAAPEIAILPGERETDAVRVVISEAGAQIRLVHRTANDTYETTLTGKTEYLFTEWGEYTIEAADALGNRATAAFRIAKVPPRIEVTTTAGILVTDGASVNSAVYIECNEEDVVIRYRVDGETFSHIYKAGTVLSGQGRYEITATDIAGNAVTCTFLLDSEVLVEAWIDGDRIRAFDGVAAGKGYIDLTFGEALEAICLRDGAPFEIAETEGSLRITEEGRYALTLTDGVGNVQTVQFLLDRTAPLFVLSTADGVTRDDVSVMLEDLADVESYKLTTDGRNANNFVLDKINTFDAEASYRLSFSDALGNTSVAEFQIRRSIDYALSIPDRFVSANEVTLTLRQAAQVSAMRNGAAIEASVQDGAYRFGEDGVYAVTLTDDLGNVAELGFTIKSNPYTAKFEYTLPRDSTYKLVREGVTLAAEEYVRGDQIVVERDGRYALTLRKDGRTGIFEFIVDTLLPSLVLNGTEYKSGAEIPHLKSDFTVAANKDACTIEIYYNGVSVPYSKDAQSANGQYRVVITDALGNVAEYVFQKDFTFNAGTIVLFSLGGAGVLLVALLLVRRRLKMRIR